MIEMRRLKNVVIFVQTNHGLFFASSESKTTLQLFHKP